MQRDSSQRFGSSKPVSQEDLLTARACLRLLKEKMAAEPPPYFRSEVESASNYRKAFKPNVGTSKSPSNPMPKPLPQAMKKPTNNAIESSKGFSKYDFEGVEDAPDNTQTKACPNCGRNFNLESYDKHVKICKNVFSKKRKKFDSAEKRNVDDIGVQKQPEPVKKKNAKWKQESEIFRANLKAAKLAEAGDEEAARRINEKTYEQERANMVKCEHCGRTFNEDAAARHIPICAKNARAEQLKRGSKAGNRGTRRKY